MFSPVLALLCFLSLDSSKPKSIRIICIVFLIFSVLCLVMASIAETNKVINFWINKEFIVVNGYEYELVINNNWVRNWEKEGISYSLENNGTWSWEYMSENMNVIGKIRVIGAHIFSAEFPLYASSEEPPIFLYIPADIRQKCYMLKGHTLPSKYTAGFSSIDFRGKPKDIDFDNVVSMEDIISYENTTLDENCERKHVCSAGLFYSESNILYLDVDIFVINEKFYIRLDDVYYPIVMTEILNSLKK